ncbi:hypothetical protein F2Q70_00021655 [Brassica cretica]|uniref:Uncharacterized protein n=1 Tax=Brassica cretica TaxID=69181 RepID=A0A8S9GUI5_BRACR|nr:hypothetical protein F2Q70_00021655 [Brassica cretica]
MNSNISCLQQLGIYRCMSSGTRSNKEKNLLFSDDPAHLERTIRRGQHSTSLDATTSSAIDTHNQPSTNTRPSSSIDPNRSTTIDTTLRACPAVPEPTRRKTCCSQTILLIYNAPSVEVNVPHRSTQQHRRRSIRTTNRRPTPNLHRRSIPIDKNGDLYDQDGHLRNATCQKIDAQGTVIPDANATGAT